MFDSEKFKRELRLQGISLKELYDRSGLNYSHLSNLKNGKIKDVKLETIIQLANHLNDIPPYRLLTDSVIDLVNQKIRDDISRLHQEKWITYLKSTLLSEGKRKDLAPQRFPIIGEVYANGENNLPDNIESAFRSESKEFITFDSIDDPSAYAVRIKDPDLSREFNIGSIVLVSPEREVEDHCICLVGESNGKYWIRHLFKRNDNAVLLTLDIESGPTVINNNNIKYIHRLVGHINFKQN